MGGGRDGLVGLGGVRYISGLVGEHLPLALAPSNSRIAFFASWGDS
jgi:hypothetical protein